MPFRADALLELWSSCRDARPTEESCRKQAKRDSLTSDPDDVGFQDAVRKCLAGTYIGRDCQNGSESARILVEDGRLPE